VKEVIYEVCGKNDPTAAPEGDGGKAPQGYWRWSASGQKNRLSSATQTQKQGGFLIGELSFATFIGNSKH